MLALPGGNRRGGRDGGGGGRRGRGGGRGERGGFLGGRKSVLLLKNLVQYTMYHDLSLYTVNAIHS